VRTRLAALIACLALALVGVEARQNHASALAPPPFESYLESLRVQAGIPGMSAAIVQEGQIVWERGFGFQNQEARIRATPDTPYLIADLSETIASVLILQCAEQRRLNLDDQIRRYGVSLPEETATVRSVLSHTSAGTPGETFKFDPDRYAQLTPVVEACVPQPYRKTVAVNILERLAMIDSVPGQELPDPDTPVEQRLFATEIVERYRKVLDRLAVPYRVDGKKKNATRNDLAPNGINTATGLVTTVRDLARFDAALDTELLLKEDTRNLAWSNTINTQRAPLPTGLGWFVQTYRGETTVWHFGQISNAYSSLILKVPSRQLTLILLANSDGLSAPFQLDLGDVTRSVFATLFLRLYS
jgi:CubicO group peptidase (beta-lactamase class C family)